MIIMNSSDRMVTCSSECHSRKIRFFYFLFFLMGDKFCAKEEINDACKSSVPLVLSE